MISISNNVAEEAEYTSGDVRHLGIRNGLGITQKRGEEKTPAPAYLYRGESLE